MTKIKADIRKTKEPSIKERLLMVQASYKEPLRNVAKTFGRINWSFSRGWHSTV